MIERRKHARVKIDTVVAGDDAKVRIFLQPPFAETVLFRIGAMTDCSGFGMQTVFGLPFVNVPEKVYIELPKFLYFPNRVILPFWKRWNRSGYRYGFELDVHEMRVAGCNYKNIFPWSQPDPEHWVDILTTDWRRNDAGSQITGSRAT